MANTNITRYNADECSVVITKAGTAVNITGFGEDMITGEKDEDFFSTSVGAQGDVVVSETNNSLGTVTLTIQPTSPQKSFLMDLAGYKGFVSIWANNPDLGEKFGGSKAKLKTYPEVARGAEVEDMSFVFTVFDYTVTNSSGTNIDGSTAQ